MCKSSVQVYFQVASCKGVRGEAAARTSISKHHFKGGNSKPHDSKSTNENENEKREAAAETKPRWETYQGRYTRANTNTNTSKQTKGNERTYLGERQSNFKSKESNSLALEQAQQEWLTYLRAHGKFCQTTKKK